MRDILRFLSLYKPYRAQVVLGLFLSTITVLSGIALLGLSGWFITAMGLAGVAGATINYFTPAAAIRALSIIRTTGRYAERVVNHDAALRVTAEFRQWFYDQLEPLAPAGLQDLRNGDIFSRLRGDIDTLEKFFLGGFFPLSTGIIVIISAGLVLSFYSPPLAFLAILLLCLCGFALPLLAERASRADQIRMDKLLRDARTDLADMMQAMGEHLIYGGVAGTSNALDLHATGMIAVQERFNRRDALLQVGMMLGMGTMIIGSLFLILPQLDGGHITPAQIGMLPLLCLAFFDAIFLLPSAVRSMEAACTASRRIFALADRKIVMRPAHPIKSTAVFHLNIRHLSFSYTDKRAIRDVSFDLSAGEICSLMGVSGVGKSSIINLLTGFWPVDPGMIFLNGQDIAGCDPEQLRTYFAVAPQTAYLFADTIAANLRIANPAASLKMMEEVCAVTHLSDFIMNLPNGYETYIGENGVRLSGGQLRRLSIARALLKDAPCLILDEPLEGLDRNSAYDLQNSILHFATLRNQAVLFIQHTQHINAISLPDRSKTITLK